MKRISFNRILSMLVISFGLGSCGPEYIALEVATAVVTGVIEDIDRSNQPSSSNSSLINKSNGHICTEATSNGEWYNKGHYKQYVTEAKRRGINCGVNNTNSTQEANNDSTNITDFDVCNLATSGGAKKYWQPENSSWGEHVIEAKRRGLDCGVEEETPTQIATNNTPTVSSEKLKVAQQEAEAFQAWSDDGICKSATNYNHSAWRIITSQDLVKEAKQRNLSCGVDELTNAELASLAQLPDAEICNRATDDMFYQWSYSPNDFKYISEAAKRNLDCFEYNDDLVDTFTPQKRIAWQNKRVMQAKLQLVNNIKNKNSPSGAPEGKSNLKTQVATNNTSTVSSQELELERQKREQLEAQLAKLQAQQQEQQQAVSADTQPPLLVAQSSAKDSSTATITGRVSDNTEVAEVTIGGQIVALNSDGSFSTDRFVPRGGKEVEIIAYDLNGNKASKRLFLIRDEVQENNITFAGLNPIGKRVKSNPNALALIIGVADYSRTPAKAAYADNDAKLFYDYAQLKLGIPSSNIKELINNNATEVDVRLAIKEWLFRATKEGVSDVFVFFAGHGLANQSGEEMYLLPYDGSPRLLEDSAISRSQLFSDISEAKPRSVTVFLDTCYSGATRGENMLIASRPIAIKAKQQSIPNNFTVFTAAGGDQTAKPLEETKHGLFSYFIMKGMEGEADLNEDNKITAIELHTFVEKNVAKQSVGSQIPELQGNSEQVIVTFN